MENSPIPKTTGRLIAFYRRANNDMKQEELAKRIGVHVSVMSEIENDKVDVGLKRIREIAQALNIPSAALVPDIVTAHQYENFHGHAFVNHGLATILDQTMLEKLEILYGKVISSKEEIINGQHQRIADLEREIIDSRRRLSLAQKH